MENKAKKLEKEILNWQNTITEKSIWLLLATLGCYGIPIERWWLLLLAILAVITVFYNDIYKLLRTKNRSFEEDLCAIKNDISEENYKNIKSLLNKRKIIKNRLSGILSFIFSIISFLYFFYVISDKLVNMFFFLIECCF